MRIAICFSGQIRTGIDTSSNILRYIGDLLPECDFFVHTWDIETTSPNDSTGFSGPVERAKLERFCSIYNPKAVIFDHYHTWRSIDGRICGSRYNPVKNLWLNSMYESLYESNQLKKRWEERYCFTYDYVIRIRPDLLFNKEKSLRHDISLVTGPDMFVLGEHMTVDRPDRVEDIFWIAQSGTMDRLVEFFNSRANSNFDNEAFSGEPGFISHDMHLAQWCKVQNIKWRSLDNNRISVYRSSVPATPILETEGDPRRGH